MSDDREERIRLLAVQISAVEQKFEVVSEPSPTVGGSADKGEQIGKARGICLRLLAVAPRPRAGLAQAMKRKEIPDEVADDVLDWLTGVGLIDDVAYAHSFVRTKHRDRALSRTALKTELRRLGVDDESMAGAVETVDSDAERSRASELISKRVDAAMAIGPVGARRRLLGLLARRGYPAEIAVPVVDQAIAAHQDGEGRHRGPSRTPFEGSRPGWPTPGSAGQLDPSWVRL